MFVLCLMCLWYVLSVVIEVYVSVCDGKCLCLCDEVGKMLLSEKWRDV